jgi:hypothetical protein
LYQGENKTVEIYITNTSDPATTRIIKFKITDENNINLAGAILRVLKRDPATNTFLPITDTITNPNGETNVLLQLDTVFYLYQVEYNGVNVYTSPFPNSISSETTTPIVIHATVNPAYTDYYTSILGFIPTVYFIKVDNQSGYYSSIISSSVLTNICLYAYTERNTIITNVSYECTNTTYLIDTTALRNFTTDNTYNLIIYADFLDGNGLKKFYTYSNNLGLDDQSRKEPGRLLIVLGWVMLCGLVFTFEQGVDRKPFASFLLFGIGIVVIAWTKFTMITLPWAMLILGLTVFVMWAVSKNE